MLDKVRSKIDFFYINKTRAYQSVFGNAEQRRINNAKRIVMEDLIAYCGGVSSNFSDSPTTMAYAEGRRSVLIHIYNYLRASPHELLDTKIRQVTAEDEQHIY
jgi:hypothetical protein